MRALNRLKRRLETAHHPAGFPDFVWWIPLVMNGLAVLAGGVAVGQRLGGPDLLPVAALVAVASVPPIADLVGRPLPWPAHTLVTGLAAGTVAAAFPVPYDFSLFVLVLLAGHIGACARPAVGLVVTLVIAAGVKVAGLWTGLEGSAFWLTALVVGWDIGFIMQYQERRLETQAKAFADRQAQAVLEERQRIAREVHDVIAHSLSVTMLHLTAARRSLEEEDLEEGTAALRDAERAGRQAMTDIRHTVGLLGQTPGVAQSAPGLDDLPALVGDLRAAGLDVDLRVEGDPRSVSPTAAVGLYRIAQESLSNVARHQPGGSAAVRLRVDAAGQRLTVTNTLATPVRRQPGGSGLIGMQQRAELLGGTFEAGPKDGGWRVEVAVPAEADSSSGCVLGLQLGRQARQAQEDSGAQAPPQSPTRTPEPGQPPRPAGAAQTGRA